MACLQVGRQHLATRNKYVPQLRRRVLVALDHCPRQRLHRDLENTLWNEKNDERPDDAEVESQVARFFTMVNRRSGMPL